MMACSKTVKQKPTLTHTHTHTTHSPSPLSLPLYLPLPPLSLTQKASLTDILDLGTGLADLSLLVAHAGTWTPSEDGEWTRTDLSREKREGGREGGKRKDKRNGGTYTCTKGRERGREGGGNNGMRRSVHNIGFLLCIHPHSCLLPERIRVAIIRNGGAQ